MLEYDRSYMPVGVDFGRINVLRKCSICHYCYFLRVNFRLQPLVCDSICHDVM